MPSATDRLEFAPPPPPGMLRAFGLAVIAHILLLLALTWGVNWKRDTENLAVEAELWSSIPQQAAPKLVEVQPPPQPVVVVPPKVVEPPMPPPPVLREPKIAVERVKPKPPEKKPPPPKPEPKPQPKPAIKPAPKAEPVPKPAEAPKPKAAEDARKQVELQRQENLRRIAGMAGATGDESSKGTALKSSGPSAGYAGRIRARIKPNIVFADDVAGNPTADVEVRTSPDGTIVGKRLIKPSGVKSWDDAVLKAVDKTEVLPRDVDGRVPSPLIISFRPKD
ncbi:hypothetical protein BH11PSE7_BH11PSE7_21810 [soil metagenome]